MKKVFAIVLMVAAVISLAGCNSKEDDLKAAAWESFQNNLDEHNEEFDAAVSSERLDKLEVRSRDERLAEMQDIDMNDQQIMSARYKDLEIGMSQDEVYKRLEYFGEPTENISDKDGVTYYNWKSEDGGMIICSFEDQSLATKEGIGLD